MSAGYFDGTSGFFVVGPTDKLGRDLRSIGLLAYVGEHHFQFTGTGEFFLKAGADSPENFLVFDDFDNTPNTGGFRKTWAPHLQDYRQGDPTWKGGLGKGINGAVNYLASKGMNVFSFLTMNIEGDDRNAFPFISRNEAMIHCVTMYQSCPNGKFCLNTPIILACTCTAKHNSRRTDNY